VELENREGHGAGPSHLGGGLVAAAAGHKPEQQCGGEALAGIKRSRGGGAERLGCWSLGRRSARSKRPVTGEAGTGGQRYGAGAQGSANRGEGDGAGAAGTAGRCPCSMPAGATTSGWICQRRRPEGGAKRTQGLGDFGGLKILALFDLFHPRVWN